MVKGRRQIRNRAVAIIASIALVVGLTPLPAVAASGIDPEGPAPGDASAAEAVASADDLEVSEGETVEVAADGAPAAVQGEEAEAPEPTEEQTEEVSTPQADSQEDTAPVAAEKADATEKAEATEKSEKADAPEKAEKPETPEKAGEGAEAADAEFPAFKQSANAGGVTVTVEADAGAFPEGARLSVASMPSSATEAAVAPERGAGRNVAASYTFDIKVLGADGTELQPADGRSVRVSFAAAEVADPNLDVSVYHVADGAGAAEELPVSESGTTATAESGGFSYYTVEFTYGDLQYVLQGGESIPLSEVLAVVGLQGEPESVEVSDPELFSASDETGEWMVASHRAFSSDEWMRVTIAGRPYEIAVTDEKVVDSGTCGNGVSWKLTGEGGNLTLTISGRGEMLDFSGPGAAPWYSYRGFITRVVIEEGVTSIGRIAFIGCSRLESVEIPISVRSIGGNAFERCSSLSSVEIPHGVTSIGEGAFYDCSSLSSVKIDHGVVAIGDYAFHGCSSLESVGIPGSVTSIGEGAFAGCSSLRDVSISSGLTSVGPDIFYECSSLKYVYISHGATSIGTNMFYGCSSLESVMIAETVTSIGAGAFEGCSSLVDVALFRGEQDLDLGANVFTGAKTQKATLVWYNGIIPEGYNVVFDIAPGDAGYSVSGKTLSWDESTESATLSAKLKIDITITADSGSKTYDGTPLTEDSCTSEGLAEGDRIESVTVTGSQTEVGSSANVPSGAKIVNSSGMDVTESYNITYVNGILTVKTAPMTVEAVDYSGKYDGETHEGGATPSVAAGTTVQYSTDGGETWSSTVPSIKDLGTVNYKVKATNPNCYDATDDGALTVTKAKATVTIAGKKSSVSYDGEEHSVSGYDVTSISNPLYTEADFTFSGAAEAEGTNAGTYRMGLASRRFENTNPNFDVTFEVTDGSLEVTKAPLTITAKDQEYVYNGQTQGPGDKAYIGAAQIADVAIVNGLQPGDSLASMILDGQGQAVGSSPLVPGNAVVKNTAGEDVTGNYDIEYVNGTLTIKAEPAEEYTVKFVNYDGAVLQSGKVAKGQVPKYEGVEPTRPETAECTYEFAGWDPEVAAVTGDATYTAKFTEKAKKGVYEAVSGAGGTWTQGSSDPLVFTFKRTVDDGTAFGHFAGILVDGKAVPEKDSSGRANWTAAKGSVVVSLQPSYLATLSEGGHTLTALFDDGDGVEVSFTIPAKAQPASKPAATPRTGDGGGLPVVGLSVAALLALCAMAYAVRRRRDS